jgi:hypothetical protein
VQAGQCPAPPDDPAGARPYPIRAVSAMIRPTISRVAGPADAL